MPEEVKKEALKEMGRLSRMSPMAADYSVTRNYIEWLAVLPWAKTSGGEVDILKAKEILDPDHYDLKRVKDRILDYLSVRRLKPDMKGPILCFVGPPGVGKTSLGQVDRTRVGPQIRPHCRSAACMTKPRSAAIAELTSARLPGQIIQGIRRAETKDPVFMLDEIDKLGARFPRRSGSAFAGGARSRAELDFPRQLSRRDRSISRRCCSSTTANMLDPIPEPLRDRMEIIELQGYTEDEKVHIAFQYLIPRQTKKTESRRSRSNFRMMRVAAS